MAFPLCNTTTSSAALKGNLLCCSKKHFQCRRQWNFHSPHVNYPAVHGEPAVISGLCVKNAAWISPCRPLKSLPLVQTDGALRPGPQPRVAFMKFQTNTSVWRWGSLFKTSANKDTETSLCLWRHVSGYFDLLQTGAAPSPVLSVVCQSAGQSCQC